MAKKTHSTHEWGRHTARDRYGNGGPDPERPADQHMPEMHVDQRRPNYDNDVPISGWLRNDATKKPGFVKPSFKR